LRAFVIVPEQAREYLMQRELSYQLPFERLSKLSRAASRKAYPTLWWLSWLLLALVFAAIIAIIIYADALDGWLLRLGIPFGALLLLVATGLVFLVGIYFLRRSRIAQVEERSTFNATIRLAQDDGGLRFATEEIEYYLKWRGISQILVDHDGVIVSHGNLFFLVPDRAFAQPRISCERKELARSGHVADFNLLQAQDVEAESRPRLPPRILEPDHSRCQLPHPALARPRRLQVRSSSPA